MCGAQREWGRSLAGRTVVKGLSTVQIIIILGKLETKQTFPPMSPGWNDKGEHFFAWTPFTKTSAICTRLIGVITANPTEPWTGIDLETANDST